MESPSMDTVYQAISALHDNPNASEKEKASIWLGKLQKSIDSWTIADELLQQKKDVQSYYFAAQTMRSKVQHNLSELPAEALVSLRDSLVSHLKTTTPETGAAILTQLCLAIADLALQMPTWQNCVNDFINCFSTHSIALLELLTVLPQEIDSTTLKLGENRRQNVKAELKSNCHIVLIFLKESIASAQSTNVALKIVKCMTSWIQVRAINIQEVPQNAVIGLCLQILRDHNSINTLHEAASDCLCALLHCLEENNDDDVKKLLFDSVADLENSYHMAVAKEEEEKSANYARLFTELAESFLHDIVQAAARGESHFSVRSLELVLVCVGHHDYEVAEITFNLWYRLSEEVYQKDLKQLTDSFKPHIERLITALARHCQCEPDQQQLPEDGDDFYFFRVKVMELIKDVVFIVGSSSVFKQMFSALQQHSDASWEQTEAALFVMQAVAKNILPEEYEFVPKVVEAILSMPDDTHPAVRKTCILLLGELCEWIDWHPECLAPCLQSLMRAMRDPRTQQAAATALQNICKACRKHCGPHAATLVQAARLADELQLPPAAAAALLRGVAAAIGQLPPDQLTVAMREAVSVQLQALDSLVKSDVGGGAAVTKGSSADPVLWLDRLAALFRDVEPPAGAAAAALPALCDAATVLLAVMDKYASSARVMERLCRALRFALRCVGARAAALLPPLASRAAEIYQHHRHSCLLYLASILVDELSAEEACVKDLIGLLQELMPQAFLLLQQTDGLKDNPDTVDDLFRLCIRFLQRIPSQFLSSEATDTVLGCARLAAQLDHREANSSVMKFLYDLTRRANYTGIDDERRQLRALAEVVVRRHGADITHALLSASVCSLHAYMLSEVAEVLLELVIWQKANGVDWLQPSLERLPREGSAFATEQQCWQFHQYAMRAEKCKEMTRLLRDFARLYR